jgi:dihydrofolate reductase
MSVSLIAALARNRVIGRDGDLPWRLPADLKHFKTLTTGHPVIMGRRTFDSIGRPLPNRTTIVITRDTSFRRDGIVVVHGLDAALDAAANAERVFVAGGAEIYVLAMPVADRMDLTVVHADVEGDTRFPEVDPAAWSLAEDERHPRDDRHDYEYSFRTYLRVSAA